MKIDCVESKPTMWNINTVIENLNNVDIDEKYQSQARWSENNMRNYMDGFLSGFGISMFVFVDVNACYENSTAETDKKYYKSWLEKTKYLNLDSNNRWTTLKKFFSNNLELKSGNYFYRGVDEGELKHIKINEGDTWASLNEEAKAFINSRKITVQIISVSTRSSLSKFFTAVNSGMPLNNAEKRNAIQSNFSDVCRSMGDYYYKNSKFIQKFFSKGKFNRRLVDEQFAKFGIIALHGLDVDPTPETLMNSYQEHSKCSKSATKFQNMIDNFFNTWVFPNEKKLIDLRAKNSLTDLFAFYCLHQSEIKDVGDFIKQFCEATIRLKRKENFNVKIKDRKHTFKSLLRSCESNFNKHRYALISKELKNFSFNFDTTLEVNVSDSKNSKKVKTVEATCVGEEIQVM